MIKSQKQGKFLVFDLGEKGVVKYDLATKEYIGKKGKPVANLCSQLRGYRIQEVIDSFDNEVYRKFLNHVYNQSSSCSTYHNVGTFLTWVGEYANHEQFFSAGFERVDVARKIKISDIPKRLLKFCKEHQNYRLTTSFIVNYKENVDICNIAFDLVENNELEMFDIVSMFSYNSYRSPSLERVLHLIKNHNYKPKSLFKYFDNIMMFEGVESTREVAELLFDYVQMSSAISNKFEKYPRHLKTIHDIAVRNYNRLKQIFDEEAFKTKINKDMEFKFNNYIFIYPNEIKEIKEEAVQQSNCVASYIKKVIEGKCHIMFMRHKDNPNKSLVTLEVSPVHKRVVQSRGLFNRYTTQEEDTAIEAFNKHLKKILEDKN